MTSYMAKDQGNFDFSVHRDPFSSDVLLCVTGAIKEVEVEPLKG